MGIVWAIVTGGRDYADERRVKQVLGWHQYQALPHGRFGILHGGATGADTLAHNWALRIGAPCVSMPADWGRLGRRAGPIRNGQLLGLFGLQPYLVIAFPGGKGTADMVGQATALNIPVEHVT